MALAGIVAAYFARNAFVHIIWSVFSNPLRCEFRPLLVGICTPESHCAFRQLTAGRGWQAGQGATRAAARAGSCSVSPPPPPPAMCLFAALAPVLLNASSS